MKRHIQLGWIAFMTLPLNIDPVASSKDGWSFCQLTLSSENSITKYYSTLWIKSQDWR